MTPSSAVIGSYPNMELQSNHTNLVKFEGPGDNKYRSLAAKLEEFVSKAEVSARKRFAANGQSTLPPTALASLKDLIDSGLHIKHSNAVSSMHAGAERSWFLRDDAYKRWENTKPDFPSCLWMISPSGAGKKPAALSSIASLQEKLYDWNDPAKAQCPSLVAHFLCSPSDKESSAIELLKSIILQLIKRHEPLASYAKSLLPKRLYKTPNKT